MELRHLRYFVAVAEAESLTVLAICRSLALAHTGFKVAIAEKSVRVIWNEKSAQ